MPLTDANVTKTIHSIQNEFVTLYNSKEFDRIGAN